MMNCIDEVKRNNEKEIECYRSYYCLYMAFLISKNSVQYDIYKKKNIQLNETEYKRQMIYEYIYILLKVKTATTLAIGNIYNNNCTMYFQLF